MSRIIRYNKSPKKDSKNILYRLIEFVYIDSSRKDEVNNAETLFVDI